MSQKSGLLSFWKKQGFNDKELDAFRQVDRRNFVIDKYKDKAYADIPLPIMRGKTISQPTTVMIMTAALQLHPDDIVFEVGTGSGYQAAIISRLCKKVITTEVIPELVHFSSENLQGSDIDNVEVHEMDGARGMPQKAPFDKIILTAAAKAFPKELVDQLKEGGIIVGPIGDEHIQEMLRGRKRPNGTLDLISMGSFRFTPLYGKYGFEI